MSGHDSSKAGQVSPKEEVGRPKRRLANAAILENSPKRAASKSSAGAQDASKPPAGDQAAWAAEILEYFDRRYPDPKCGLVFREPFELLAATILSAQCTDKRVNQVTPGLMAAFPDAASMSKAPVEAIEELVKTCGLYRAKAKNLRSMAKTLVERFDGRVPADLESLTSLPGVGRKTANVVLGDAFGIPGLTVDTHLGRVSRRLGLSAKADAAGVERDLMELVPKALWTRFSHQGINHGRDLCRARKPLCPECELVRCPARESA